MAAPMGGGLVPPSAPPSQFGGLVSQFPTMLQTGRVKKTIRWEQATVMMASGQSRQTLLWHYGQAVFTVQYDVVDDSFLQLVESFYNAVQGDLYTFLFQDWTRPNPKGVSCGVGDGVSVQFKTPGDAFTTLQVFVGGVAATPTGANPATGFFNLAAPPALGVRVTANVTGELYLVQFPGFTTHHVHGLGWLPYYAEHLGGNAYRAEVNLVQYKAVA